MIAKTCQGKKVTTSRSDVLDDAKEKIILELYAAISQMVGKNISVLSQKDPKILSVENIFDESYPELELNIPFLFNLLSALLGDSGM
ncbi:hypothetical protein DPMN_062376 [Dreissena polymorpha]|uniref:Uncharacterized protein n=1 Tax=Dreissena polymorpha TaxID=45954 RepID=A0A9D4HJ94_DREPO|nr:hypothetical protein DPMN_062376 [Dreissena polymorpha]